MHPHPSRMGEIFCFYLFRMENISAIVINFHPVRLIMKILYQIAIIFSLCLLGEMISALLPFPFPAAISALILLTIALFTGILKIDHIKEKSDFLLSNMAFFFIPAGVKVIEHFELIASFWWQFFLIVIVSTVIVFAVTGWTVSLVIRFEERRRKAK